MSGKTKLTPEIRERIQQHLQCDHATLSFTAACNDIASVSCQTCKREIGTVRLNGFHPQLVSFSKDLPSVTLVRAHVSRDQEGQNDLPIAYDDEALVLLSAYKKGTSNALSAVESKSADIPDLNFLAEEHTRWSKSNQPLNTYILNREAVLMASMGQLDVFAEWLERAGECTCLSDVSVLDDTYGAFAGMLNRVDGDLIGFLPAFNCLEDNWFESPRHALVQLAASMAGQVTNLGDLNGTYRQSAIDGLGDLEHPDAGHKVKELLLLALYRQVSRRVVGRDHSVEGLGVRGNRVLEMIKEALVRPGTPGTEDGGSLYKRLEAVRFLRDWSLCPFKEFSQAAGYWLEKRRTLGNADGFVAIKNLGVSNDQEANDRLAELMDIVTAHLNGQYVTYVIETARCYTAAQLDCLAWVEAWDPVHGVLYTDSNGPETKPQNDLNEFLQAWDPAETLLLSVGVVVDV